MVYGSGNTLATYYYDAFGNIVEQTGTIDNNITYAGYQYDKETGKYYLNARMYDPVTARFMQEDTYRGSIDDPLSLNLYTYCHNEPLMYTDPTGHFWIELWGGIKSGYNKTREVMHNTIQSIDNTTDEVVQVVDNGVNNTIAKINNKVDNVFNTFEQKLGINDNNYLYSKLKFATKKGIGQVEGFTKEAISTVTGLAQLGVKYNPIMLNAKIMDKTLGAIENPTKYYNSEMAKIDTLKSIYNNRGQIAQNAWNGAKQFANELQTNPYSRGQFEGQATFFVGSLFVGAGEAKAGATAGKVASKASSEARVLEEAVSTKAWQVGDDINAMTKSGNYPSWSTVKARYWKNTVNSAEDGEYSLDNLARMSKGKAPLHSEIDVPMELHHINGRSIVDPHNISNLQEVWPWEHAEIDPFRYYNGPRP